MPGLAVRGRCEVFADGTSNPWGCDYDAAGNFFVSACVIDHFFHMAPGGIYVRQGGAPENPYAYEQLPSIVKHKHFRAAYAGVQIYQGGRYPADTHGHAFIGNIHDNAIHEEILTPVGASFKCEPRRDFLRANDGWFRPVSSQTGPDGFLWIMGWCDKYPCYQNAKANPEGVDRQYGRIWRVVLNTPSTHEAKIPSRERADLDLKKLSTTDLVKTLEHPNSWMRRMARRMLVEREFTGLPENKEALASNAIFQTLTSILASSASSEKRLSALTVLTQIASDDIECQTPIEDACNTLINDKDPVMRAWAIRCLAEVRADTTDGLWVAREAGKLAQDTNPMVRLAAANAWRHLHLPRLNMPLWMTQQDHLPLQYHQHEEAVLANFMQATVQPGDSLLPLAIWMAIEPLFGNPEHISWEAKIMDQFAKTAPSPAPSPTKPCAASATRGRRRTLISRSSFVRRSLSTTSCSRMRSMDSSKVRKVV